MLVVMVDVLDGVGGVGELVGVDTSTVGVIQLVTVTVLVDLAKTLLGSK